jgi:hypothetical protein
MHVKSTQSNQSNISNSHFVNGHQLNEINQMDINQMHLNINHTNSIEVYQLKWSFTLYMYLKNNLYVN